MRFSLFLIGLCCLSLLRAAPESPQPNIVIILADDLGYTDLGAYGGEINTPNLDRLAAEGVKFNQFYNNTKCWSSRASLLTGVDFHRSTRYRMLSPDVVTIAEVLKPAGYKSYLSGKWHLRGDYEKNRDNLPTGRGFDEFFGTLHGAGSYYDPYTLTRNESPIEPDEDFYYTDAITDEAIQFLNQHRVESPQTPFFLYLAYTAPHWPLHARPEDIAKYKGKYDGGWEALRQKRFEHAVEQGIFPPEAKLTELHRKTEDWEQVNQAWNASRMEVHAAMVDCMDRNIGRLLADLKKNGQYDNTLILFMSDNGPSAESIGKGNAETCLGGSFETRDGRAIAWGNQEGVTPGSDTTFGSIGLSWANAAASPFKMWKGYTFEGGINTPMIASWPVRLKEPGRVVTQPGHLIDVMPTLLEVTAASYPESRGKNNTLPLEGQSLLDNIITPATEGEDRTFYFEFTKRGAILDGKWKLVCFRADKQNWELYDLEQDPTETNNLIETHPDIAQSLAAKYNAWWDSVKDDYKM